MTATQRKTRLTPKDFAKALGAVLVEAGDMTVFEIVGRARLGILPQQPAPPDATDDTK